jgi:hypothetical protein
MRAVRWLAVCSLIAITWSDPVRAQPLPRSVLDEPHEPERDSGRDRLDRDRLGWAVPDFLRIQTGGWIGTLNLAVGYSLFDDVVNLSAGFGFTPDSTAGHTVRNADLTLALRPFRIESERRGWYLVPIELGATWMVVLGDRYRAPDRYRSGYYPPTAEHWLAHVGFEIGWLPDDGLFTRHAIYFRAATLDTFAQSFVQDRGHLELGDVIAGSIGYRAAF